MYKTAQSGDENYRKKEENKEVRMKKTLFISLIIVIGIVIAVSSLGFGTPKAEKSVVPIPPSLVSLPTIKAKPWLQVEPSGAFLEGPAFDLDGNLYVSSLFDSRILKITPDMEVTEIFSEEGLLPDGIAIHQNGKLFVACLSGKILEVNPDGSSPTYIPAEYDGKLISANDLVFDSSGNFYVTDFTGNAADPTGGVYYFSYSSSWTVQPVFENMASANGVALAPEGNILWVSETCRMQLHRLELLDAVTINPIAGAGIPYRFTGGPGGCDSMAVDDHGNVYQALIFQGRLLILNKGGIPIANVVIPGRDEGRLLRTTNVAFKPGTDEAYITVSDDYEAWIYKFKGLAEGVTLYSHQQ